MDDTPEPAPDPGPIPLATWAEGFGLSRATALAEIEAGRLQPILLPPPDRCDEPAILADDDEVWAWAWVDGSATLWWMLAGSPAALGAIAHAEAKTPGLGAHIAALRASTGYGPGRLQ